MGSSTVWGTYKVFEGRDMSGVMRWRYFIGVGEGGRKGCPLTGMVGLKMRVVGGKWGWLVENGCGWVKIGVVKLK